MPQDWKPTDEEVLDLIRMAFFTEDPTDEDYGGPLCSLCGSFQGEQMFRLPTPSGTLPICHNCEMDRPTQPPPEALLSWRTIDTTPL